MMIAGRQIEPSWPFRIGFFAVPMAAFALVITVTRPPAPDHRVIATLGGRGYDLLVADTSRVQQRGLQGYAEPAIGHGMLFSFDHPQQVTIAMKTVDFPIDVAFIDAGMRVVRTVSMQPPPYGIQEAPSGVPVKYVVEAPSGSFIEDGVGVGTRLALLRQID